MNGKNRTSQSPKSSSFGLRLFWLFIAACMVFAISCKAYAADPAKPLAIEPTIPQPNDHPGTPLMQNDINNPAGEVIECELTFLDLYGNSLTDPTSTPQHPSPDYPARPNDYELHAATEYVIRLNFPDMLLAEIENGDDSFVIEAEYQFEVEKDDLFRAQVKLYNVDSGNLYVGNGIIRTDDDLCVKHSLGKSNYSISNSPDFEKTSFSFSVWTSALPDAGPKTTNNGAYGGWGYHLSYTITGTTED